MVDLSKYPAYTKAMELSDKVMKSYDHYKGFKHTLGDETLKKSLALLDCVIRGLDGFNKQRKLKNFHDAIDFTQEIESRILLAANNQCLGDEYTG